MKVRGALAVIALIGSAGCQCQQDDSCRPECGVLGQPCCESNTCNLPLGCAAGICQDPAPNCGGVGEPCCAASSCEAPFDCVSGTCRDTRCGIAGLTCCTGAKKCLDTLSCISGDQDQVGQCAPACDPFAPNCPAGSGCIPDATSGFAGCVALSYSGKDGAPCFKPEDCHAGFYCVAPTMSQGSCRPYCGGIHGVPCTNGRNCIDLSATVQQAIVGVCAG